MSKKKLREYLSELDKEQLQDQILDLYSRFKEVKVYYDFAFNPKEDRLLEEAKIKVSKEYNLNVRKPKARRSVAQKWIRHFKKLEVHPEVIADFMCFNIEIAQVFSAERRIKQDAFYQSMLNSFTELCEFVKFQGLYSTFKMRLGEIVDESYTQEWINRSAFQREFDKIED